MTGQAAWNRAAWLGPLVTFAGAVSYFMFFVRFPALRDFPWVNLPLVLIGLGLSVLGARRAFARGTRRRARVGAAAGLALSALLAAFLVAYVFALSYALPAPAAATLALDRAPDFELRDQHRTPVRLSSFAGRKVVLVFYRGFW